MIPFSQSEESFLYKNVQSVIDIWARGLGTARLNFAVKRGQAELQLYYQLGHPESHHLHPHPDPPTKRKSEKKRLKDNRRAAAFQARRAATSSTATSTTTSTSSSETSSAVSSIASKAVTSPTVSTTTQTVVTSFPPSNMATAVTSPGNNSTTQQAVQSMARCTTTSSLETPILFHTVTSTEERCELFAEMDALPLPEYPDCSACGINFDFPCFATPCMECGMWFHNGCVSHHRCVIDDDDIASYSDLD